MAQDTQEQTQVREPQEGFTKEQYLEWYEQMMLMRRFEEKAQQMYMAQKIRGFLHLYIGQEAVVAGSVSATQKGDKFITAYRDHAHAIALGIHPNAVMAELFGKETGCSKGKGGSMHMFSNEHNFFGGHGIVGAQIPLGAGIAFAEKYKETGNICLTYMGDGAVRQGALHETFTMSMLWKLPVIFIVENNKYGMGTAVERTTNVPDLYRIGQAFDMPSYQVDGMDVEAVHHAIAGAARRAREEFIPTFLEILTYRYKGHSISDPAKYRKREEVDQYRSNDPIERLLKCIRDKEIASDEEIETINNRVDEQVEESVRFSEESDYPKPEELYRDVYIEDDYPFLTDDWTQNGK